MEILKPTKNNLNKIIETLNFGGVVVCPTDTVYGFLADATNKKAILKIFKIKKRSKKKPLPIFVKDFKMAKELAEISSEPASARGFGDAGQEKILKKYWPGKYTFILKSKKSSLRGVPVNACLSAGRKQSKLIIGRDGTVALRIPKYKYLNDLLKKINKPLAQTSVNISGQPPLTKINEIIKIFSKNKNINLIIDAGNLSKSKPSKIIDLTGIEKKIVRK